MCARLARMHLLACTRSRCARGATKHSDHSAAQSRALAVARAGIDAFATAARERFRYERRPFPRPLRRRARRLNAELRDARDEQQRQSAALAAQAAEAAQVEEAQRRAQQATLEAMGPTESRVYESGKQPSRGTRRAVGCGGENQMARRCWM